MFGYFGSRHSLGYTPAFTGVEEVSWLRLFTKKSWAPTFVFIKVLNGRGRYLDQYIQVPPTTINL